MKTSPIEYANFLYYGAVAINPFCIMAILPFPMDAGAAAKRSQVVVGLVEDKNSWQTFIVDEAPKGVAADAASAKENAICRMERMRE